ncbi:hypothetical protein D1AOALGA4SA_9986 [Olavius algarvensis Delta 1 endosymbiont]|nr:hypothetical protein D1AOALGA4SA_9986 [Olavius algarvensis Delta 1 endosymbiont]
MYNNQADGTDLGSHGNKSIKCQITKLKFQINLKIQCVKSKTLLDIEYWNLFEIWCLYFGV